MNVLQATHHRVVQVVSDGPAWVQTQQLRSCAKQALGSQGSARPVLCSGAPLASQTAAEATPLKQHPLKEGGHQDLPEQQLANNGNRPGMGTRGDLPQNSPDARQRHDLPKLRSGPWDPTRAHTAASRLPWKGTAGTGRVSRNPIIGGFPLFPNCEGDSVPTLSVQTGVER